ncbi:hypothetical protein GDO86_013806 [Hymenochirus boettgeri]|uniref:Uncharacterized protein n=1 Tax=Hymenochirus boettgeri TaxID=247094 RepID=A0A8T2JRQ0_9PIPI|nr:hypothetical protein GDO86_013806 [Hymenochirus boettgeri]
MMPPACCARAVYSCTWLPTLHCGNWEATPAHPDGSGSSTGNNHRTEQPGQIISLNPIKCG